MQLLIFTIVAIVSMIAFRTVLDAARSFWHIQKVLRPEEVEYLLNQKTRRSQ